MVAVGSRKRAEEDQIPSRSPADRHRHDLAVRGKEEKLLAIPPPARAVPTVAGDAAPVSGELRRIASLKALHVDFVAALSLAEKARYSPSGRQGGVRAIEGVCNRGITLRSADRGEPYLCVPLTAICLVENPAAIRRPIMGNWNTPG